MKQTVNDDAPRYQHPCENCGEPTNLKTNCLACFYADDHAKVQRRLNTGRPMPADDAPVTEVITGRQLAQLMEIDTPDTDRMIQNLKDAGMVWFQGCWMPQKKQRLWFHFWLLRQAMFIILEYRRGEIERSDNRACLITCVIENYIRHNKPGEE